jgi:hypothetical protein
VKIDDSQLYALLAGLLDGHGRIEVTPATTEAETYSVEIDLEVYDNHRGDSPDVVLNVALTISVYLFQKPRSLAAQYVRTLRRQ